jgi:hypothetical protein
MKVSPLLIGSALSVLALAPLGDNANTYTMQDGKKCAASGSPGSSAKIKALDLRKVIVHAAGRREGGAR